MAAGLAAASALAQAPADDRIALVIGNSLYPNAPLPNPANDARAMTEALRGVGFRVLEVRDADKKGMESAIARVSELLKNRHGIGMLYYAGHGMQLDWHNYMVPVDARIASPADVQRQAVDLSAVIDAFKTAGNRMNIVVLDACRDNPFSGTASAKGLAQLDAPPGTFLAYATAPGNVAEDGETDGNGLYTRFLLAELGKPGAKIEDVFKRVRLQVRQTSQGRQVPWESTSLEDDFSFNGGEKRAKPDESARIAAFDVEKSEWERVRRSSDPAELFAFLRKYPSSSLAQGVQYRLDRLAAPAVTPQPGQGQSPALAYTGDRFRLGDRYAVEMQDSFTGVVTGRVRLQVTKVTDSAVEMNQGNVVYQPDGSLGKKQELTFDPPLTSAPSEFSIGKSWGGFTLMSDGSGPSQRIEFQSRVTGRETITVPAGTFQTWVVETTMHGKTLRMANSMNDGTRTHTLKSWFDPRYGIEIQGTRFTRDGTSGIIRNTEKWRMVSLNADRPQATRP